VHNLVEIGPECGFINGTRIQTYPPPYTHSTLYIYYIPNYLETVFNRVTHAYDLNANDPNGHSFLIPAQDQT
jgi:hypothetical protein